VLVFLKKKPSEEKRGGEHLYCAELGRGKKGPGQSHLGISPRQLGSGSRISNRGEVNVLEHSLWKMFEVGSVDPPAGRESRSWGKILFSRRGRDRAPPT